MKELVIVGGGFAGVWAAMGAAAVRHAESSASSLRIRMVSRDPFLTIRPRLYEAPLPAQVRVPLTDLLDGIGVELTVADVTGLDLTRRAALVSGAPANELSWDGLVLAAGSRLRRPAWHTGNPYIFCVDTYEEALRLDRHLRHVVTSGAPLGGAVAVVGSGLAGLEVATTMATRVRALAREAGVEESTAKITLLEAGPHVAPGFGGSAHRAIEQALSDQGVRVLTGSPVVAAGATGLLLEDGRTVVAATVVWTGGLEASPLTRALSASPDPDGRVAVDQHLVPHDLPEGADGVFVAGDCARAPLPDGHDVVMSCQHAMPLGRLAGHNSASHLLGLPLESLETPEYVTCVDLGEAGAVFTRGWDRTLQLTGPAGKDVKRLITEELIYPPLHDPETALAIGRGGAAATAAAR